MKNSRLKDIAIKKCTYNLDKNHLVLFRQSSERAFDNFSSKRRQPISFMVYANMRAVISERLAFIFYRVGKIDVRMRIWRILCHTLNNYMIDLHGQNDDKWPNERNVS